ncbi:DUF3087 family protein [Oceanobacter mangrovi]|uniref:DUF3087 family protein n=1 Tax=Oceanobacter mangrovi TaxID=2862510 RepID=UPI001C8D7197|nr:DUF3087 family protein [Oceanobacter mangrovi]
MELKSIDKPSYKKHLNLLQFGGVALLLVLALGLSSLYRSWWGNGESNTGLNLLAVITAVVVLAALFSLIRQQPWMADIRYTWQLKQELNRIYRHSKVLEKALADGDENAFRVHFFSLHGSLHLYRIEDNTLTVPELQEKIAELDETLRQRQLVVSVADYRPELIDEIKQRYR